MKREDFIRTKDYLVSQIQLRLLNLIGNYKDKKKLNDSELAEELGVSKSYVSQLLNASFDHKLSKVVDLALACDTVPLIYFVDVKEYVANDKADKEYQIYPVLRLQNVTFDNDFEVKNDIYQSQKTTSNHFCKA